MAAFAILLLAIPVSAGEYTSCGEYCRNEFYYPTCVGELTVSGEYPSCVCEFRCYSGEEPGVPYNPPTYEMPPAEGTVKVDIPEPPSSYPAEITVKPPSYEATLIPEGGPGAGTIIAPEPIELPSPELIIDTELPEQALVHTYEIQPPKVIVNPGPVLKNLVVAEAEIVKGVTETAVPVRAPISAIVKSVEGPKEISISPKEGTVKITSGEAEIFLPFTVTIEAEKLNVAGKEINVLPDEASARAKELAAELEIESVTLEIGEESPGYLITGVEEGRFLFIFPVPVSVKVKVSADTGEATIEKPWWAFLVS